MKKYIIIGTTIILIGAGYFWFRSSNDPLYSTATVQRSSISQEISASGNIASPNMINLQFQNSGKLVFVGVKVGDKINTKKVIARQDASVLNAQLQQAQATFNSQQAKLQALKSGAQPIDASSIFITAMRDAYLQTETAILRYADTLFENGVSVNPVIKIRTQNQNEAISIQTERLIISEKLKKWKDALLNLNTSSDSKIINNVRDIGNDTMMSITVFLNHLGTITANLNPSNSGLSQTEIDTHRTTVNTAAQTASTGVSKEQDAHDIWASAPQNIGAQEATVESARASVAVIQAQIAQMELVSPVDGTITEVNGDVGEIISPSTIAISIIPDSKLQIDVNLSENNVGNVRVGDPVRITLDAFSGLEWQGVVARIDPAQTIVGGAVYYKTTVLFRQQDNRTKPGMTANVLIETGVASSTLVIPASAIQTNGASATVELLQNGKVTNRSVTTGLKSQSGKVEIISGLSEGDQVVIGTQ